MPVSIHIHEQAQDELNSIDNSAVERIKKKLREMVGDEFRDIDDYDVERIQKATVPIRRTRIGDWRAFFQIHNRGNRVVVLSVNRREHAYDSIASIAARAEDFSQSMQG